jgi:drug/metabolite transporter (DMT)-like permease
MRIPALILGFLLLVAGALVAAGVFSYNKKETVAKLGPMELTATEKHKPAPLVGYVLFGAGALVLALGYAARK